MYHLQIELDRTMHANLLELYQTKVARIGQALEHQGSLLMLCHEIAWASLFCFLNLNGRSDPKEEHGSMMPMKMPRSLHA